MAKSAWFAADRAQDWWDADRHAVRQGDVVAEIGDDSTSIVLYRAGVAQTVRLLTPAPTSADMRSAGGSEAQASLLVLGQHTLNIQRGDEFLLGGLLYRVIYVAPEQPSSGERKEAGAVQVQ